MSTTLVSDTVPAVSEQVRRPHPSRLAPDHPRYDQICQAHDTAVRLGLSSYRDPGTGYTVLTTAYLHDRGYCCSSGCRHCPYLSDVGTNHPT